MHRFWNRFHLLSLASRVCQRLASCHHRLLKARQRQNLFCLTMLWWCPISENDFSTSFRTAKQFQLHPLRFYLHSWLTWSQSLPISVSASNRRRQMASLSHSRALLCVCYFVLSLSTVIQFT